MANTILRLPAVKARVGLSRSSIYLRVTDGTFPQPVSLGARAVGWVASEVDTWVKSRITASRAESGKDKARYPTLGRTRSRSRVRSRGKQT